MDGIMEMLQQMFAYLLKFIEIIKSLFGGIAATDPAAPAEPEAPAKPE